MRLANLFGRRLREAPADAELTYQQLLVRGGFIQQLSAGIYMYLPLGWRVHQKLEQIVRDEMNRAGGQELRMPALQPLELWEASGRREKYGAGLFTLLDRRERGYALGPTHEEVFVEAYKHNVQSYRDLPQLVYQIQNKFRDEPRPRGGLLRLREFTMKDLYSFDENWEGLDRSYRAMYDAYVRVFDRAGVPVVPVQADSGTMGGKDSQEFIFVTEMGEDTIVLCPKCGYSANTEKAIFAKGTPASEDALSLEEVDTPGVKTIEALAKHLGIPESKTAKAVFYVADGQPVFVVIRGDLDVNEVKLLNALAALEVRPMSDEEVVEHGLVAGSASPIGQTMTVIADDSVADAPNLVAGANKADRHLLNTNHPRDWKADVVADIALARAGDPCSNCGAGLELKRGLEMGHVFKLGTVYAEKMGATFLAADGTEKPAVMGSYGIGIDRLLAAVVEANHDERGIIWPRTLAPYDVHLVALNLEQAEVKKAAERLYEQLVGLGLEVVLDDRDESPGIKFNDADLIGLPLRATVSSRSMKEQSVELKPRAADEASLAPLEQAAETVQALLRSEER
ncbi:MAG TPA: proline--tRNA ligase [Dehalococcoidia bacterium]|nr:proline--tRNA ligase [Dehalococcoidia bacterium]